MEERETCNHTNKHSSRRVTRGFCSSVAVAPAEGTFSTQSLLGLFQLGRVWTVLSLHDCRVPEYPGCDILDESKSLVGIYDHLDGHDPAPLVPARPFPIRSRHGLSSNTVQAVRTNTTIAIRQVFKRASGISMLSLGIFIRYACRMIGQNQHLTTSSISLASCKV